VSQRAEPQVSDGENLAHEMGARPLSATAARFTGSFLTTYAPGVALAKPRSPQALCFRPLRGLKTFGCGFAARASSVSFVSLGWVKSPIENHKGTKDTEEAQRKTKDDF
jgi:hypothetical protein